VVRRRLTLKRIDPWSVLKFGFVANIVLLVMFLLVAIVVWFIIDRLAIVDQLCDIALDVGFTQCGVNFGNLFRALVLLGLLWVVVQTAVLVFFSFLHNLLADLTGGLAVTVNDTTPGAAARTEPVRHRGQVPAGGTPGARTEQRPATTGRPPVPPLQRDPEATASQPRQDAPHPDPHAPAQQDARRDSGEVMFGDRRSE
jgi:hypothetical protein